MIKFDLHILWMLSFTMAGSYLGSPHCFLSFTISLKLDIFQDHEKNCNNSKQKNQTQTHANDGERIPKGDNGVIIPINNYTRKKTTTRTHLLAIAPPHPGKKNKTLPSFIQPFAPLVFSAVQVGIAKITGKAFVDGQKVLEVKEFTCNSDKKSWVFQGFLLLCHTEV